MLLVMKQVLWGHRPWHLKQTMQTPASGVCKKLRRCHNFCPVLSSISNSFQAGLDTGSVFFLRGIFYFFCRIDGFTCLQSGFPFEITLSFGPCGAETTNRQGPFDDRLEQTVCQHDRYLIVIVLSNG